MYSYKWPWLTVVELSIVSESDILGPIHYLGDIENLVSCERAMFEDNSFKLENEKIPSIHVNITTSKFMPKAPWTVYNMSNIGALNVYQYICGQINKIILQRDDIFTSWSNNFDTETL